MDAKNSIFVSIASYRDPELVPTLLSLIDNADCSETLHIAICLQDAVTYDFLIDANFKYMGCRATGDFHTTMWDYNGAQIEIIKLHYYESKGVCWARNIIENLYNNEKYFLQIDSHCRFISGWNREMINIFSELRKDYNKPLLTSYPPGYKPGDDEENTKSDFVSRLVFREFNSDQIPVLTSVPFKSTSPVRGSYLAAGFIFTTGDFTQAVPNDPNIFFIGEEISMAVRAFTHGYDIFHPHKVLLWHYYQRDNNIKVWDDHDNNAKDKSRVDKAWWERDRESKARVKALLGIDEINLNLAPWSLGNVRTLKQFEHQTGISFKSKNIRDEVTGENKINFFDTNL